MRLLHLHGREKNLAEFGWTDREAEWIALVCLHSGCFLRSQMCRYLQIDRRVASTLVRSIVANRFASETQLSGQPGPPHLCRISHRQIYRALGAENIRHRRAADPRLTLIRLLGLDYVLEHPTCHWLPTNHEKVHFFHSNLNIPTNLLPSRVYKGRAGHKQEFFVSKYPIAHQKNTVTFLYVDPHDLTDKPLRSWLSDHRSLLDALSHAGKRIHLVVVASDRKILTRAERILRPWSQPQKAPRDPSTHTNEVDQITCALRKGDADALKQWGGPDAAFTRMNALKRQSPASQEATVTSPIDSCSIWHSTRLASIDFSALQRVTIDSSDAELSCDRPSPDTEGGLSHI